MSLDRPWLQSYPKGVPAEIDVNEFHSVASVFDASVAKFRDRPAYSSFGKVLTYGETDALVTRFAAYLLGELKLKKGDRVVLLTGKDKGRQGAVLKVFPKEQRVLVEGLNIVQRHTRPTQGDPQGGIKNKEAPVHVSNVAFVDPKTGEPTRVGFKIEGDKKVRVAKKSGEVIDG